MNKITRREALQEVFREGCSNVALIGKIKQNFVVELKKSTTDLGVKNTSNNKESSHLRTHEYDSLYLS